MKTYAKEEIETVRKANTLEAVLANRGFQLRRAGQELVCKCPFHEDGSPSFNVNPAKQVWTCRAGCGGGDVFAFVEKLDGCSFPEAVERLGGREEFSTVQSPLIKNIFANPGKPATPETQRAQIVATYSYTDAEGKELFQAVRLEPKSFRQRRKGEDGRWIWNLNDIEPVIYKLPEVLASEFVWVVEGEKDAESIGKFGLCATCNPMGAGKWKEGYTQSFKGKYVFLCGDNDEPGEKHMDAVERALAPVAASTRRVRVPAPHKDVTAFLEASLTPDAGMQALMDIAEAAPELFNGVELPLQNMAELERDYRNFVKQADKRSLCFELWLPKLAALRPVVPGELVFLLASTGAGKTASLQNIAASIPHLPTLFFELELPGTLTFERFAALAANESARDVWNAYKRGDTVQWRESGALNHVHVCSKSGIKVAEIERIVNLSHLKIGARPAVVMVDYIGLVKGEGTNKYEQISGIAEDLKVLAKNTNTIVICSSQVARGEKDKPTNEISIYDGKGSGSIENSCGVMFGLWRDAENPTRTYLRVLKSTKGGSGLMVNIDFHGDCMAMEQSADQAEYVPPKKTKPRRKFKKDDAVTDLSDPNAEVPW